jgi:ribonucleoside-diphosphate reductase alpha chain
VPPAPPAEPSANAPQAAATTLQSPGPNNGQTNGTGKSNGSGAVAGSAGARALLNTLGIGRTKVTFSAQADAPSCADCGSIMVRNGSCYKCLNCGSTSGCS